VMTKIDKMNVADEMLDAAICEFLDAKRFAAALNLAGVAEELYRELAKMLGKPHSLGEIAEAASQIAVALDSTSKPDDKVWYSMSVKAKNEIKHIEKDGSNRVIEMDAEDEARAKIGEALTTHDYLDRPGTEPIARFWEFAREWSQRHVAE